MNRFPIHHCDPDDPCPVLVGASCEGKGWRATARPRRAAPPAEVSA